MVSLMTPLKVLFTLAVWVLATWGGFRLAQTNPLRRFWGWKPSLPIMLVVVGIEVGAYIQVLPGDQNPILTSAVVALMLFTAGLFSGFRLPVLGES